METFTLKLTKEEIELLYKVLKRERRKLRKKIIWEAKNEKRYSRIDTESMQIFIDELEISGMILKELDALGDKYRELIHEKIDS